MQEKRGQPVRVAVDVMGGDFAPGEIIKGALEGAREHGVEVILVGNKTDINRELSKNDSSGIKYEIVEATEKIADGEQPAIAVLKKRNSSIALATGLVKAGKADAVVSAGPTGAVMTSAWQYLGALPGIDRPMIGGNFLGFAPKTVTLDLGANVGCQPYHLVNFAVVGTVYVKCFLGVENPSVGLLNVGSEEGKGTDTSKEAYGLLKKSGLNFIGNIEGMDIPAGKANVVVCDGFVGNILLKLCEGLSVGVSRFLGHELEGKMSQADTESLTKKLVFLMSPAATMGGGPLWGVNGVACKTHGSSKAPQIAATIKNARVAVETDFITALRVELEKAQKSITA